MRTEWLLGKSAVDHLRASHVAVFGVGGVGSYAAEALARSGVGAFTLIDHDVIEDTNINRQLHALHSTMGRKKVTVTRDRLLDINPQADIDAIVGRFLHERHAWPFSYIVDAVDTVPCKMLIIEEANARGIPVISAMGAGNRLDPTLLKVGDISETKNCPLARAVRKKCRKSGIERLKVVFSAEPPFMGGLQIGSNAFVPAAMGLVMAKEVVMHLAQNIFERS